MPVPARIRGQNRTSSHDASATLPPLLLLLLCCLSWQWQWQRPWLLHALPLCTDSRAPAPLNGTTLGFCAYSGSSCCDAAADAALKKRFEAMSVSDAACAAVVKSVLCAKCSPFSAELFNSSSKFGWFHFCATTPLRKFCSIKDSTQDYCKLVWETCKDVTISNSPFQPSLQGSGSLPSSASKLTGVWQSENDFCTSFGGSSDGDSVCFSGDAVSFNNTDPSPPLKGVPRENRQQVIPEHGPSPDGSTEFSCLTKQGRYGWQMSQNKGLEALCSSTSEPFLDLTDEVHLDSEFGLMGAAFHQSLLPMGASLFPITVIELNRLTVLVDATSANPSEVSRIFTMGLPYTAHHAGQILFGPTDGYLYFMMGDGGNKGDPFNFSQNKKSLLGKIMRLDIDNVQSQKLIGNQSLWGNYSIPKDNPFAQDSDLQPEIWALGLETHGDAVLILRGLPTSTVQIGRFDLQGGNYGWRAYEGPYVYHPGGHGEHILSSANAIFPAMGYNHSTVNKNVGSASITGGYMSTVGLRIPAYMEGTFADLSRPAMWTDSEAHRAAGTTPPLAPFSCSRTPDTLRDHRRRPLPSLGYIFSPARTTAGRLHPGQQSVYRVVRPSLS
ncbi:hypothetical protein ZWY2020_046852 [Hordeum vulgare]|nr:hypothetical protein ZWY2020_046852 [Hordeum vulgare]